MDDQIIAECKQFIEKGDADAFRTRIQEMLETEYLREPDWPYIFHRIYLHACLKGRSEMATWLQTAIYPLMDPIQQIALRQIFPYGRTLLQKAAQKAH